MIFGNKVIFGSNDGVLRPLTGYQENYYGHMPLRTRSQVQQMSGHQEINQESL